MLWACVEIIVVRGECFRGLPDLCTLHDRFLLSRERFSSPLIRLVAATRHFSAGQHTLEHHSCSFVPSLSRTVGCSLGSKRKGASSKSAAEPKSLTPPDAAASSLSQSTRAWAYQQQRTLLHTRFKVEIPKCAAKQKNTCPAENHRRLGAPNANDSARKKRKNNDGKQTCLSGHARNFTRVVHNFPSRKFVGCVLRADLRQLHDDHNAVCVGSS